MESNSVGSWIAFQREQSGISQHTLSVQFGVNQSVIAKMELGIRKITFIELLRICDILNVDTKDLLDFVKQSYNELRHGSLWQR